MPFGVHELPRVYDTRRFDFMGPVGPHMPVTEAYVCVPPALVIRDNEGAVWTLGFDYSDTEWRTGRWEYDILRNGRMTGEFGRTIEFRQGKVIINGADGRRVWNGRRFV
jgi:hypothetical protein